MRPRRIEINGRRFFRRGPGNTYHSVEIVVDGELAHIVPYAYGYGNQYEWTARQWLKEAGYLPDLIDDVRGQNCETLYRYCGRVGCQYQSSVQDVKRKKDLHQALSASRTVRAITRRATSPHGRCRPGRCLEHEYNPEIKSCLP